MTFVDLCVIGWMKPEQIDVFVALWHEGDSRKPLHEFLGLTKQEYARWAEDPASLEEVIRQRKEKIGN